MATPAVAATYYVQGTYEPDTYQDATEGFMITEPDRSSTGRKAYFNVWPDVESVGANPNVGLAGSRIMTAPQTRFYGMLGVWKDCNGDGFVGMADGALWEYRRELLADSLCAGTRHVVGDWVWEFHWIGPQTGGERPGFDNSTDTFLALFGPQNYVNDTAAKVWGDWGLPGEKPARTCEVGLPSGTTGSTGGVIAYADCFANRRMQNGVNSIDGDGALGLRIDGEPQRSDSLLNQGLPHLWYDPYNPDSTGLYEDDSGDPAFQTWDCDQRQSQKVADPVAHHDGLPDPIVVTLPPGNPLGFDRYTVLQDYHNDDGSLARFNGLYLNTTTPAPSVTNPTGSYYDGLNNTRGGLVNQCGGGMGLPVSTDATEGADTTLVAATRWVPRPNPESSGAGTDADLRPKRQHDIVFSYRNTQGFPAISLNYNAIGGCTGTSNGQPFPPGCSEYPTRNTFPINMPKDFGLEPHRGMFLCACVPGVATVARTSGGIGWHSTEAYPTDPQVVDRTSLGPKGPQYATFYASVGTATTALGIDVPSGRGTYGSEWCGEATSGAVNGFDCDADNWWNPLADPATAPMPTQRNTATNGYIGTTCTTGLETPVAGCREIGAKPGLVYQFRDIDCWDGTLVRGTGVQASLVALSGQAGCRDAPVN